MPNRIQRQRVAGWCMPDNTVYVGRPTFYGNPFSAKEVGQVHAVDMFRDWLAGTLDDRYPDLITRREVLKMRLPRLRGKNLACWCSLDHACHADHLLELAKGGAA